MFEENVVRAAGASYCMDEVEIVRNIENAGFTPMRRTMHYDLVGSRCSASAPCRAGCASTSPRPTTTPNRIPDELATYDARTPAAKRQRAEQRGAILH